MMTASSENRPIDCLCAGLIVADFVAAPISRLPRSGELTLTPSIEFSIGGCAANVATDLARLERRAALVGIVGEDMPGAAIEQRLSAAGVHMEFIRRDPHDVTSSSLIVNVVGDDRRFIHAVGANRQFDGSSVTDNMLRQSRILSVGGFCLMESLTPERLKTLFERARQFGVQTVLDVVLPETGDYSAQLQAVLPSTDVFLPNTDEATRLCGTPDPIAQAQQFLAWGAKTVIITCGGDGVVAGQEGRLVRSSAFKMPFVDGTGSGDAFVAGYIDALLDNEPFEQALKRGSALGASCVRAVGATCGVFRRAELQSFLADAPWEVTSLSALA